MTAEIDGRVHWKDRRNFNQSQWQRCCKGHVAPVLRYTTELLRLKCGPDLLALRIFPDAKELAESFAVYSAVKKHLPGFKMDDPGTVLLSVGDGHVPRTGAVFAHRTSWACHSIDPCMRRTDWCDDVKRLEAWRARAEDLVGMQGWPIGPDATTSVVIVGVHTHARWDAMLRLVSPVMVRTALVVMPCCEPEALPPGGFDAAYDDDGVPSPDRTVYVYGPEHVQALQAVLQGR